MLPKLRIIFVIFLLPWLLAACAEEIPEPKFTPEGSYAVDPTFREFYNALGGEDILGPAITPLLTQDGLKCQYTETALLVFDPQNPEPEHYLLSPLGLDMGVAEAAVPKPDQPETRYLNGHVIYQDFVPLFDSLGGVKYVGNPISEVHYNPEQKRFEQFFENMGFYHLENDDPGVVRLLSYGLWRCDNTCRSRKPLSAAPDLTQIHPEINPQFAEAVARLGSDFAGLALTDAYINKDGVLEQIFENVVLMAQPDRPGGYALKAVEEKLGVLPGPMVPASGDPRMFFYPIQGDLGYNIPQYFLDYITNKGGFETTGLPLGEVFQPDGIIYRQCFTNLCLDFDPNAAAGAQIKPAAVGYTFKEAYPPPESTGAVDPQSNQAITMQVLETYPTVTSTQGQEIVVSVLRDNQPVVNVEPVLILTLPDGSQQPYPMPPTSGDGQTRLTLPAISAPNSTLIPYQVCMNNTGGNNFCVKDNYLIWNNP